MEERESFYFITEEKEEDFPDFGYALVAEEAWKRRCGTMEAKEYLAWKESGGWNIIEGIDLFFARLLF